MRFPHNCGVGVQTLIPHERVLPTCNISNTQAAIEIESMKAKHSRGREARALRSKIINATTRDSTTGGLVSHFHQPTQHTEHSCNDPALVGHQTEHGLSSANNWVLIWAPPPLSWGQLEATTLHAQKNTLTAVIVLMFLLSFKTQIKINSYNLKIPVLIPVN